jgi:hypothetical protein
MKSLIICVVIILSYQSAYSDDIPKEFQKLLDRGKLTFEPPENMELTKIKEDTLMWYNIAYKDSKVNYEIRISILPLDSGTKEDDNLNIISLAKDGTYKYIDVIPETFNADKSAVASFDFAEDYGSGYKHCGILLIFKKKCAVVNIFFLSAEQNSATSKIFIDNYQLIKFKK